MYKNQLPDSKLNMSAVRLNILRLFKTKKDVSLGRENQSEKP